jgi:hypothetical protein
MDHEYHDFSPQQIDDLMKNALALQTAMDVLVKEQEARNTTLFMDLEAIRLKIKGE